jgi:hypothetical protein
MQPNDQIIQIKLAINEDRAMAHEDPAGPTTAASNMCRVVPGNVVGHRAHRHTAQLQCEANLGTLAPASVNHSSAPKKHALRRH